MTAVTYRCMVRPASAGAGSDAVAASDASFGGGLRGRYEKCFMRRPVSSGRLAGTV
jgi:hypothetical protein